jgi:hypothetical protein
MIRVTGRRNGWPRLVDVGHVERYQFRPAGGYCEAKSWRGRACWQARRDMPIVFSSSPPPGRRFAWQKSFFKKIFE